MRRVASILALFVAVALLLWWMFELPGVPNTPGNPTPRRLKSIDDFQSELKDMEITVDASELIKFRQGVAHHLKGAFAEAIDSYSSLQECHTNTGTVNLVERSKVVQHNIRDAEQHQRSNRAQK